MASQDPYHTDPWLKKGRGKWGDSQAAKDDNIRQFRQTRKKARRELERELEEQMEDYDG